MLWTRRRLLAGAAAGAAVGGLALWRGASQALFWSNGAGNAVADPYSLGTFVGTNPTPFNDIGGRTPIAPVLNGSAVKILMIGDSVCSGTYSPAYVPTHVLNQTFNVNNGGIYTTADPILGQSIPDPSRPASLMGPLLDAFMTAGKPQAVGCSVSIGGTRISDWTTVSIGGNSGLANNFITALRRFAAVGFSFDGCIFLAGPNDTQAGTTGAAYSSGLSALFTLLRANGLPQPAPIFVCQCSQFVGAQSAQIRTAQINAVDHGAAVWFGIDADSFPFQADATHHTAAANLSMASALRTSMALFGAPFS